MEPLLLIAAGTAGVFLLPRIGFWYRLRRAGVTGVSAAEMEELIRDEGALVVDVREEHEYRQGRIPAARHVPLSRLAQSVRKLERERERPIVVSCRSGRRSAYAGIYLARKGFPRVYNLKGGVRSWARSDREIES